ncbi:hypothetical protein CO615_05865 [Lysobacteraceae bacterium NML75-0749]|nr:hypothetical protein CO615_05865 [Xanthomonadaceae bacterium NML75-0749]PJK09413.1 hypothetical protein CO610_03740 [Xanthomonadaceae bacterium NML95-0200]
MNISPLPPQPNWIVLVSLTWGILSAVGTLLFMLQALGFAPFLPAYAYMPLYILIPFGILGIIVSMIAIVLQKSARHLAIIGLLLNATTLVPTGIFLLLDTSLSLL